MNLSTRQTREASAAGPSQGRGVACSIYNFRDYGGYRTRHGALRHNLLFRSGEHREAGAGDLEVVASLRLTSVIDLRSAAERQAAPCPRPAAFEAVHLHADDNESALAPHLAASERALTAEMARETMISLYRGMAFRPYLLDIFARYLHVLAEGRGPSLVHCAAGKDRTGMAVAMAHLLAGVHPDDVMEDYLLTNTMADPDQRVAKAGHHIRALYGAGSPDEAIRVVLGVEPAFLAAGLDAIRNQHGSVEAYAKQQLNFSAEDREALLAALHD